MNTPLQDGERLRIERKLLDRDNPGLIFKIGASQKLQVSFRSCEQSKARIPSSFSSSRTPVSYTHLTLPTILLV
eukprot:3884872-Pyramimonas_sp.AAC.1